MAITSEINTPEREGNVYTYQLASNTTIYAGSLVAINSSYLAINEPSADTDLIVGRAEETAINPGTSGAIIVRVKAGVFRYANAPSPSGILAKNTKGVLKVGKYSSSGIKNFEQSGPIAGIVVDVDDDGVWIDTRHNAAIAAAAAAAKAYTDAEIVKL